MRDAVIENTQSYESLLDWLTRSLHWWLALIPLTLFGVFASLLPQAANGRSLILDYAWVPSLNVNFTLRFDGLGLFMALIVSGIGALVILYAGNYLKGEAQINRFYSFITFFMLAMLLLVLSDNIFLLFVAWELTSISSFFLIGFHHREEKSQKAALQALLVTGTGGLAMMAGLILLTQVVGSANISEMVLLADGLLQHDLYVPILVLILLGAFTKSAQFPFHFWLPNAMAGPTPVSTYLHSATMVTAGVYLLARLNPILSGTAVWFYALTISGGITALLGAWLSWQKTDLKGILAYSTISALGVMVFLIGLGTEAALTTAVVFLLIHALYKAALFMGAGIIDHETGTRDIRQLGGLWRDLPLTFVGVLLAALSMAGIPPLLGFVGKELMYEATLEQGWVATAVTLLTNIMMVTAAAILLIRPFFGAPTAAKPHHKPAFTMWLGPIVLGSLALLLGIFSESHWVSEMLVATAVGSVLGHPAEVHLALWHGLTPMLGLSVVTLTAGGLLYAAHTRLRPVVQGWDAAISRVGPARWYTLGLDGMIRGATAVTRIIQNGYLRYYLLYVIGTFLMLVGLTFLWQDGLQNLPQLSPIFFHEAVIIGVIFAAVWAVVRLDSRLATIASLGVVGYGIALLYILFGAPDLAMTQFAVETLTVILFVLVLYRLPHFDLFSSRRVRIRDATIAIVMGLLMGGLVLAVRATPHDTALTDYFSQNSYQLAHGRNIVNVILVDFRGFDTMVEITVLSVAAIGVYALLKSRPHLRPQEQEPKDIS